MRLIDADALIMALRLEYPMMPMFKENQKEWEIKTDGYRKAEEVINDAPTIEPKRGEWIPCSERLPEENGRYLVTFPTLINKPWIDILWYGRPTFPETDHPCFYASDDEYGDVEYDDVVAWMPLPDPYKGADNE